MAQALCEVKEVYVLNKRVFVPMPEVGFAEDE
jgi:16S rRNA A1518/A1519 N6-dimethyltransferase RsmA/KsgA/DIM1 with predicted DNA glycosylase/AP lyase activity